jgi:hypothetical protein
MRVHYISLREQNGPRNRLIIGFFQFFFCHRVDQGTPILTFLLKVTSQVEGVLKRLPIAVCILHVRQPIIHLLLHLF